MHVGQRVREIRVKRGMPLAEMARRAKVSRQTAYLLERDGRVGDPILARIARVLDTPLSELDPAAAERISELAEAVC